MRKGRQLSGAGDHRRARRGTGGPAGRAVEGAGATESQTRRLWLTKELAVLPGGLRRRGSGALAHCARSSLSLGEPAGADLGERVAKYSLLANSHLFRVRKDQPVTHRNRHAEKRQNYPKRALSDDRRSQTAALAPVISLWTATTDTGPDGDAARELVEQATDIQITIEGSECRWRKRYPSRTTAQRRREPAGSKQRPRHPGSNNIFGS
jgi:hypothetical protein